MLSWLCNSLSLLAQWIVVPVASFLWLGRIARCARQFREI
jgi:hypothetical protein